MYIRSIVAVRLIKTKINRLTISNKHDCILYTRTLQYHQVREIILLGNNTILNVYSKKWNTAKRKICQVRKSKGGPLTVHI